MLADIYTVFHKEWKELIRASSNRSTLIRLLIWVAIFGGMIPLESKEVWLNGVMPVIFWSWISLFYVSATAVGMFAGERERHTLETLLATRLPNRAILLGKVLASVTYGWALVFSTIVVAVVAINVTTPDSGLLMYTPAVGLGGSLMSLLAALLVSGLGVLISLRAGTARQAQMIMYVVSIVLFVPFVLSSSFPQVQAWMNNLLVTVNTGLVTVVGSLLFLIGSVIVLSAALARFKRSELILD